MKALSGILSMNRKAKALAALLALVFAADLAFYLAYTAPAAREAAGLDARVREVTARLNRAEAEAGVYNSFEKARAELELFRAGLSSRSEYTGLMRRVYDMARDDGMKGSSFGTQLKSAQAGGIELISFSMPVSGRYEDVRRFIHDVEDSDMFLNIDSLGLAGGESGGEVSLSIGLSTYVRR